MPEGESLHIGWGASAQTRKLTGMTGFVKPETG
jgi:hypothetical protein